MTLIDYSIMTDQELNIEVAKRQGWTVDYWNFPRPHGWALIAPDASTIMVGFKESDAWDNAPVRPADDANEALAMWNGNSRFHLTPTYGNTWVAWVEDEADSDIHLHYTDYTTASRAATICWLKYQDAIAP